MKRLATLAIAAAASSSFAGCYGYGFEPRDQLRSAIIGREEVYFPSDAWDAHENEVVRQAAAPVLQCPPDQITAKNPYHGAYAVHGCDRDGVFLVVSVWDSDLYKLPGHEKDVYIQWDRVIDLVHPSPPPPPPSKTVFEDARWQPQWGEWAALVAQGAKDLECPVEKVLPDIVPQGKAPSIPLAEGCGKRATYVSEAWDPKNPILRLSSLVPIK